MSTLEHDGNAVRRPCDGDVIDDGHEGDVVQTLNQLVEYRL